jgi:hypothetical protein
VQSDIGRRTKRERERGKDKERQTDRDGPIDTGMDRKRDVEKGDRND